MNVFEWLLFAACVIYCLFALITKATDRTTLWFIKIPIISLTCSTIIYILWCNGLLKL